MSTEPITLYDIPCKAGPVSWSINVWKTRLVLNYKQIPYKTTFLDHRYLGQTLKDEGFTANAPGPHSDFTAPAIECPSDGSKTMDSAAIAPKLEAMYPSPSLHLDAALHPMATQIVGKIGFPLLPELMPRIASNILVEDSVAYWKSKMEPRFGMTVEEFGKAKGGEPAWQAAQPALDELKAFVAENKKDEGPFVMGSQVSYSDFIVVAMLHAFRCVNKEGMFDRIVGMDTNLGKLYDACKPWLENDK